MWERQRVRDCSMSAGALLRGDLYRGGVDHKEHSAAEPQPKPLTTIFSCVSFFRIHGWQGFASEWWGAWPFQLALISLAFNDNFR